MSIEFTCPECGEQNNVEPEIAGRRGNCSFCGAAVIVPQASGVATSAAPEAAPRKSRTLWIVLAVVVVVCLGLVAYQLALTAVRRDLYRLECANNIKQISLAPLYYEDQYGFFPPGGGGEDPARMSWRVAILPMINEGALYQRYDPEQPWNSPKNLELLKQMPRVFRCRFDSAAADAETSYVMITGKDTVGGVPGSHGTRRGDITNGPERTILVVEVHGLKIPWTEPRDITLDELIQRVKSGARIGHVAGFNVGMADGSAKNLPNNIDVETLRRLAIMNDGPPVDISKF